MTSQTTQAPVVPTTGTYTIDAAHSSVGFSVRHVGIARVRGTMGVFSGQFVIADPIEQSKADVKIDASSVDTGNKQRDEHLVSADFWDAEKNPEWTFTTTSITGDLDDMTVTGDLTINGVTKPVTLSAEFGGAATGPSGETRASFSATTSISRKDFGLTWNVALEGGGVMVSDKVNVELDVVGVLEN